MRKKLGMLHITNPIHFHGFSDNNPALVLYLNPCQLTNHGLQGDTKSIYQTMNRGWTENQFVLSVRSEFSKFWHTTNKTSFSP